MFLYYNKNNIYNNNKVLVILLIEFLLILCENGLLTKEKTTTVTANGNTIIPGPFLQLERPKTSVVSKTIKNSENAHLLYYLACVATIEESFYYQNETEYCFTWFRNDKFLANSSGRHNDVFLFQNGTLRLPPNEKANGVYRCKINANILAVISEAITVEYPVLRRITAATNINALSGLSLTFNCPVLSVPPANVTWFYDNVSLPTVFKDSRYLILTNGSLVLRQVTSKDGGRYKCLAINQFAGKSHRQFTWTLTVEKSKPLTKSFTTNAQLIPTLQNVTQYIPFGADRKLLCYAKTDAVPVEWWFQRTAADAAPVKLANHSNAHLIHNANVEDNEGYYTCSTLSDNQTFHVVVTIPPTIIEPLPSFESLITASMTFNCSVFGNPRPEISWYHNGEPLHSSYTRYINGNELFIHSFDPDEVGIYQCFARNIAGEVYTAAEIRLRNRGDEILLENPLHNIRCFAHSINAINVTFDSKAAESLFIVHIVQSNPHRWISPFPPTKLNNTSYVVISSELPAYHPFELITRVLFPTSVTQNGNKPPQQTILSSLRSPNVTCCTQGLLLHLVHLGNDTFVTWSQPELPTKKYFVLQFSTNYTQPHPQQLLGEQQQLRGATQLVDLTHNDVERKLTPIVALNATAARAVMQRAEGKYIDNDARASHLEMDEDIYSLVVEANVTGILLQNFTRIKLRVLIITSENEDLKQDFRYVQWKIIDNDTSELANTPFRLTTVESRMLVFHFQDSFNETCAHVCYWQNQFPNIIKMEPKCESYTIANSQLEIRGLKPTKSYRLTFYTCDTNSVYGQLDVKTLPDPPGTISNQRVTKQNGLKLSWDPPMQPNGKIHHYNILWTLNNVTHEANVLECSTCFYKFPNVSDTDKINVTVRVVGETGWGAPIFIDLRNIHHYMIEEEHTGSNSEVYSGIAIGSLLSTFCVFCFALLIIFQRRRFKARQQGPTHLTSPSDMNFGNLSNTGIPGDSAGGLSGSTMMQQDCHEMQTLIPKSASEAGRHIQLLAERPSAEYQTTQLPNGNGSIVLLRERSRGSGHQEHSSGGGQELNTSRTTLNSAVCQILSPLCTSTPLPMRIGIGGVRESVATLEAAAKPFFIPFKQHTSQPNVVAAAALHKYSSSSAAATAAAAAAVTTTTTSLPPPFSLPLATPLAAVGGGNASRRSGSLSSSSSSSASSSASRKQFHTNFSKHSKSTDAICLLAEEESAATLTPTSDTDVMGVTLTNGFKAVDKETPTATTVHARAASPATPPTTSNTPLSSTSRLATNINNNNAQTRTKPPNNSRQVNSTNLTSRQQAAAATTATTQYLSNTIVPAIGPAAAATTSTAAAKHWTAPKAKTTTASLTPTTTATSKLQRRPNVDPNG